MKQFWILFWSALVFGSILWYAFLVFYVGRKAGREIFVLMKTLGKQGKPPPDRLPR